MLRDDVVTDASTESHENFGSRTHADNTDLLIYLMKDSGFRVIPCHP
jgi:hypothetical protein